MFGAIAHFERRLIAERTRDRLAAAVARGSRPGRPPVGDDTVAAAITLIRAGHSPTNAARQLSIGRSTLYRLIGKQQAAANMPDVWAFSTK